MSATSAHEIARLLAERIELLVADLLPGGRREGHEWRSGSVAGDNGNSLGVHLSGTKAGVWSDFATGDAGDALDLVKATLQLDTLSAIYWSKRWLGLNAVGLAVPERPILSPLPCMTSQDRDPDRWRRPWQSAEAIGGTIAETYLRRRGLIFTDPDGLVLRFNPRRARKNPDDDQIEYLPALLAALNDVRTGEQVGIINTFLRPDGRDRVRDRKGKTTTGRAKGAAVMLTPFDEVTLGLTICEGIETGIALLIFDLAPVWALGSASNLRTFPVLGGIAALTVAADADETGKQAAETVAARWRALDREVVTIAPPIGDWANPRAA